MKKLDRKFGLLALVGALASFAYAGFTPVEWIQADSGKKQWIYSRLQA